LRGLDLVPVELQSHQLLRSTRRAAARKVGWTGLPSGEYVVRALVWTMDPSGEGVVAQWPISVREGQEALVRTGVDDWTHLTLRGAVEGVIFIRPLGWATLVRSIAQEGTARRFVVPRGEYEVVTGFGEEERVLRRITLEGPKVETTFD
jgi:hypothetical protein